MFKICVGLGLAWLAWLGSAWLGLVCLAWRLGKSGQASGLLCLAWLGFGGLAWLGLAWLVGLAGAGLAGLGWGRAWLGYNSLLRGLRAPPRFACFACLALFTMTKASRSTTRRILAHWLAVAWSFVSACMLTRVVRGPHLCYTLIC